MFEVRRALDLYKPFIVQSQIDMAMESEGMELNRSTVDSGVEAVLRDSDKGHYLIAHLNGDRPAGCLLVVKEWSDWRNGWVLWIHSVYVLPEFRKMGAFKAMYQNLKETVEASEEYKGIRLYVEKANERASKVYEGLGMTDEHYNMFEWMHDESN